MNVRSIALIAGVGILGIGLLMTISSMFNKPQVAAPVNVAVAAASIEPYTIVTQDMLKSTTLTPTQARDRGAYPVDFVPGKMSTARIAPGDVITTKNALPPEEVRYVKDLNLEIVSFSAGPDKLVGGKLRPGHIVNIYGAGRDDKNRQFTVLIEPRVWVVGVSAGGGPVSQATLQPDPITGEIKKSGPDRERTATLVTVAVPPDKAFHIIDALGAQKLDPWLTLAANQTPGQLYATPVAAATATNGLPYDLSLTATALSFILQSTPPPPLPHTGGGAGR
ncbi:MAG: SAF domain-containing protein [Ardenticatenales bacterium]